MSDCGCEIEIKNRQQGRTLIALLVINACMFLVEIILGIVSESAGLIADSLDMLADAAVYGVGLYAVGREAVVKIKAAFISGILEILLGLSVVADIARRAILGSEPEHLYMILVGLAALAANMTCLWLIAQHRHGDVHMRASWIFSKNDVIANLGIIISGGLVYMLDSRIPDLLIGLVIAIIVIRGGVHILADARKEYTELG